MCKHSLQTLFVGVNIYSNLSKFENDKIYDILVLFSYHYHKYKNIIMHVQNTYTILLNEN